MTLKASRHVAFLLIGGRSALSAPLTTINESQERLTEQIDGLGDNTDKWGAVGARVLKLEQEGFYNDGVGSFHEALETADPQVLLYGPAGNVLGDDLLALTGVRTTYDRLPSVGTFHKAKAVYKSTDRYATFGNGKILVPYSTYTDLGPTNHGTHDNLASTAAGAYLWIAGSSLNLDGGTNLTVVVHHSTDNFAGNDVLLGSFTVVTVAPFAQRVVVAGTVNRYTRARVTFTGASGANRSAAFTVGIQRL